MRYGLHNVNPFMPIPNWARGSILLFAFLYTSTITIAAFFNSKDSGVSLILMAMSNAAYLFCILIPVIFYRPQYGWAHPLVFIALFSFIKIILKKTGVFVNGLEAHIMLPNWEPSSLNLIYAYGNILFCLSLITTYVGFHFFPRPRVPNFGFQESPNSYFYPATLAVFGFALIVFLIFLSISGGIWGHLKNIAVGAGASHFNTKSAGLGQYIYTIHLVSVVSIIWVAYNKKVLMNPILLSGVATSCFILYFLEGKRSQLIFAGILMGLVWAIRNQRIPYTRVVLFGIMSFFLLGILGLYRTTNWTGEGVNLHFMDNLSVTDVASSTFEEIVTRGNSGNPYYACLALVPHEVDLKWGQNYLEWVLRFIPRFLWPNKPRGVDVQSTQAFHNPDADWGMPLGTVGEAYWNGHIFGILIVFSLFGVFLRWSYELLLKFPHYPAAIAIYSINIFYFVPSQNGFRRWLYIVVPALIIMKIVGLIRTRNV